MDMRQKFPEKWITSFEQGTLLTLPAEVIFYESDRRKLSGIGAERLSQLSALLAEYPQTYFIVEGHHATDIQREANLDIAFQQAKKVGRFLRRRNIEKERFEVVSYGCQQRLVANGPQNNRIEIVIVME
jgi:outer membrane protein OmpA-like peptidoglycan-associated protein